MEYLIEILYLFLMNKFHAAAFGLLLSLSHLVHCSADRRHLSIGRENFLQKSVVVLLRIHFEFGISTFLLGAGCSQSGFFGARLTFLCAHS
jgi:hypothetical protein